MPTLNQAAEKAQRVGLDAQHPSKTDLDDARNPMFSKGFGIANTKITIDFEKSDTLTGGGKQGLCRTDAGCVGQNIRD